MALGLCARLKIVGTSALQAAIAHQARACHRSAELPVSANRLKTIALFTARHPLPPARA